MLQLRPAFTQTATQDPFLLIGRRILTQFKPTLLDIGGAAGLQPHWLRVVGNSNIVFFEPHPQSYQELKQIYAGSPFAPDLHYLEVGLSKEGGTRDFYQTNCPTGSSLYEPNPQSIYVNPGDPYYFPFKRDSIQTQSLKQCLDQHGVERIDGMKLDIQGAELEVIQGLDSNRLDGCLLIESEVGLVDVYKNGTLFVDIKAYLEQKGFELLDMRSNRAPLRIPGTLENYCDKYLGVDYHCPAVSSRLYEVDAVFFKHPKIVVERRDRAAVHKLVYLYCIYNFFAEALHLLELALQANILDQAEANGIGDSVLTWHKLVRMQLAELEGNLAKAGNQVWSQYLWTPYPCT